MAVYKDRVKETSTTTGTGTYSLAGAATGFQAFSAAFSTADTVYYCAEDGTDWEVGLGTLTTGAPWTLARTSITASSNAGAAVNWSAGTRNIFCVVPASAVSGFGVAGSDTQVMFNDGGAFGGDSGFTFNKTNNTLTLGGATVTTSQPVLDLSQTWNAAVTFTGFKANFTNTSSNAGSLVADFQLGGTSKLAVGITSSLLVGVDAANTLALRNSTNAQTFNLYNTYTDASNYERGFMRWASNVLEIGTENAGTGTGRKILFKSGANPSGSASAFEFSDAYKTSYLKIASQAGGNNPILEVGGGSLRLTTGITSNETLIIDCGTTAIGIKNGRSSKNGATFTLGYGGFAPDANNVALNCVFAAGPAAPTSTSNIDGGNVTITGGAGASGSAGDADGGHIYLDGGQGYGTGDHGGIYFAATRGRVSYFNVTPVAQQSGTGETVGFTAGAGTAVLDDSTFTGNVGSTAYRISDVVKALKNYGLLAA